MPNYKHDIKDEEKGHERYEMLARKDKKNTKTFSRMAEDEERHEKSLKKMAKTRALKSKYK